MPDSNSKVLIAGGGPVGLVAALALGRAGIPVTVLEKGDGPQHDLRASTFHPPTLDMLDAFGITPRLIEHGLIAPTWQFRDRATGPVAIFDMSLLKDDTAHPYRVQCEQWRLVGFLLDDLARLPHVEVRYRHALTGIAQDDDGVRVDVDTTDGATTLSGRWLIGAEGARSPTRKALDIGFDGMTLPELFLVVSTPFRFEEVLPQLSPINYMSDPDEWLVLLRTRDFWRVLVPADPNAGEEHLRSDAFVRAALKRVHPAAEGAQTLHRTLYPVHQRVAATYQVGRAFLAGDSAHINNPLGGMGMNGGIHDALELARLLVEHWEADDPARLAVYTRRRRPVAHDEVQAATLRNRQILNERDPAVRNARLDELRRIGADPVAARNYLLKSSMILGLRQAATVQ
jgi:3-(3-hydroxy-phenyl)propionate hydroxylase